MKVLKIMSIIGIVWFSLSLLFLLVMVMDDAFDAASGWGMLGLFYALPFAIVALVQSSKK